MYCSIGDKTFYKVCIYDDPSLTLISYGRIKFGFLSGYMGKIVLMSFHGKNLKQMTKVANYLNFTLKFGPYGDVCPFPGTIYMHMTMIIQIYFGGAR